MASDVTYASASESRERAIEIAAIREIEANERAAEFRLHLDALRLREAVYLLRAMGRADLAAAVDGAIGPKEGEAST